MLGNKLSQLPYWNNGINHIVFDFTDLPNTFYSNKNGSIFKSAFSVEHYNPKKDVSIPQFPRYRFPEEIINKKSDVVPAFLRSTKHLTNEDWDELSKVVQKMNKKND